MKFLELLSGPERLAAAETMRTPDGFAWLVSQGKQQRPPHLRLLGKKLADMVNGVPGAKKKLVITFPPRHGKSHLSSWWFPTWFLFRFPELRVMLTSYEADFASTWGRMTRNTLTECGTSGLLDFSIAEDSKAADQWNTSKGGGMVTVGAGGALTGRGYSLGICDDIVKNFEEAQSEVYRNKTWDWFRTTFLTRAEPGAVTVVIGTRWNEDDMIGRILSSPDMMGEWDHIDFPAIAEEHDALGRKPGEALWPERYDVAALLQIKKQLGSYGFSALYQQRPVPAEGGIFKTEWFKRRWRWLSPGILQSGNRIVELAELRIFCTVDLATSVKTSADFTVISTWGSDDDGVTFLLDCTRERMEGPDIQVALEAVIAEWNPDFVGVEKVGFQLSLIQQFIGSGLPIREMVPDKDKVSRALSVTPHCEAGRIVLPDEQQCEWIADLEHELYSFPNGKHDDFVDTLGYLTQFVAFGELGIDGDVDLNAAREVQKQINSSLVEPGSTMLDLGGLDFLNLSTPE